jgi:hypothetical protein
MGMANSEWRLAARLLDFGPNYWVVSVGHLSNLFWYQWDPLGTSLPLFIYNTLNNSPFPGPWRVEADH